MLTINNQVMQCLIYYTLYGGMVICHEFLQHKSRAHTYLKNNQPHKHLSRNVTHSKILHGMNLIMVNWMCANNMLTDIFTYNTPKLVEC